MINLKTFTAEHIQSIRGDSKRDPALIERSIFALGLLEALTRAELTISPSSPSLRAHEAIVDAEDSYVQASVLKDSSYITTMYDTEDIAPVSVLEGCEINLTEVFV